MVCRQRVELGSGVCRQFTVFALLQVHNNFYGCLSVNTAFFSKVCQSGYICEQIFEWVVADVSSYEVRNVILCTHHD